MKRLLSLMAVLLLGLVLAGCVTVSDDEEPVDCEKTPFILECIEQKTTECEDGEVLKNGVCVEEEVDPEVDCILQPDHESCEVDVVTCTLPEVEVDGECVVPVYEGPGLVEVLDALPSEDINITFWHVYGQEKEALLQDYINEFELLYPNITIEAESQGGYDDLRNKTILSIASGQTPTMLVGYPDHVAVYLTAGAVIPLDDFIYDDNFGVEITDFIDSYLEENRQYAGGLMFSLPYSKSTEMMVFNKTKFDAMGVDIPMDRALTWAELDTIADTMVGDGTNQCEFLINFDSSSNFFINNVRMWGGGYTNSAGEILVDDAQTRAMLAYVKTRFDENTFALPIAWNQQYGSANFKAGDSCMTVGSTAGISYNIPDNGEFEIGVAPIPQYDLESKSATQQGPNVAIMADSTDAERLAAWMFIKYITDAEQTAKWSMLTGYLPVRYSGYTSDIYQEFLTSPDPDYKYESMTANAAYIQIGYNDYDPAFAGQITSADAREEVGLAMETIFVGTATIDQAISDILTQLGAN
jgi:multiple sugar transport system substrate-binding protein